MAEYLIQSETLDDIADAINAKTGGSSAMTPAEMVTAIGSISGGGGELLVDNVATEDVSTINLVLPEGKGPYRIYIVELVGETSASEWIYPHYNTTTPSIYGAYLSQKKTYNSKFVAVKYGYGGTNGYVIPVDASGSGSTIGTTASTLNNIFLNLYNASSVFRAGFEVKVWGYDI